MASLTSGALVNLLNGLSLYQFFIQTPDNFERYMTFWKFSTSSNFGRKIN